MAIAAEDLSSVTLAPPLKWAGGKRWLVPELRTLWFRHSFRRLVEPFAGGLAVSLGLTPHSALLNDVNEHLVSFYCWVQRGLDLNECGLELGNSRETYDACRQRFNALIASGHAHSREAAVLFYYLNRTGFNGLCRFNASGFFNVPFGRYARVSYRNDFSEYVPLFSNYTFACGDFEALPIREDDFIYADPPYDVTFTTYSAGGFPWSDQERVALWLAAHPGPVVTSNQATTRVLELYESLGFDVRTLRAPRRISCDGNRAEALEMLATRNL